MLKIVTGADSGHFYSMLQFINSLKIFEKGLFKIVVYNLGLLNKEIELLKYLHPDVIIKDFDYKAYPDYFDIKINSGQYAWKPVLIADEYNSLEKGENLLWLDAGCFVRRQLLIIRAAIQFSGFYSPFSAPFTKEWTHPSTLAALDLVDLGEKKMLSSGLVGLANNKRNSKLVYEWAEAARNKSIIGPNGSNKSNHRYDQSLLSLLFHKIYQSKCSSIISHKWLEVLPHKDLN